MSFLAKIGITLALLSNCYALSGQDRSDLSAFESFFQEQDLRPVEKVLHDANMRLEQAIEIADAQAQAHASKVLGLIYLTRTHDNEKAMDFFIHALAIEDSLNLHDEQVLTYVAIARVFEGVGDCYYSAQFLDKALKLNDRQGDFDVLVMILNNLGKVNAASGAVEKAFESYQRVLKYKRDIK